jgi:energy-converting hydrogenase A subunit R
MRVLVLDCEGPISRNDNAFELTQRFLPGGARFFALVSRYDDVQAELVRRPGYRAGDTLRLVAPFLLAHGATTAAVERFSRDHIRLLHGAKEMLRHVRTVMPSYIVSTSYEPYIAALCDATGFPPAQTYSTTLDLDRYDLDREAQTLRNLAGEIVELPMIEVPEAARSLHDLSRRDQATVARLDTIFWDTLRHMEAGRLLQEIRPVGGEEKAKAVREILDRTTGNAEDVMYVGDSITDARALFLVKEADGLAVAFNGNGYAIRSAEVAVLADSALVTAVMAQVFAVSGKARVLALINDWSSAAVAAHCGAADLVEALHRRYSTSLPQVARITADNAERLVHASSRFRKTVRGEAIGRLG